MLIKLKQVASAANLNAGSLSSACYLIRRYNSPYNEEVHAAGRPY